jgi:DNA-binding transcriptional ArsR family regulator
VNDVFRAIADPTRREILDSLARKEVSVGELARDFSMSLPAVSQHLRVLQDAQLIVGHREGRHIFYHLTPAPLRVIARWVNPYEKFWKTKLDSLEAALVKRHGRHHP